MDRRAFLRSTFAAAAGGTLAGSFADDLWPTHSNRGLPLREIFLPAPVYSVTPIVGDGNWVWTDPPKGDRGYLQPRKFAVMVAIELKGLGDATHLKATTVAPVEQPEQAVAQPELQGQGCQTSLRTVAPTAGQLLMAAPTITKGQTIRAEARYEVTISKDYRAFEKDQFPARQKPGRESKSYLGDSPGIQIRGAVVTLARQLVGALVHPWDRAYTFYEWVWENIRARRGAYTSVAAAVRDHEGDCEERGAVFVAMCRAVGIPARIVWVPNHNWTEIHLHDEQGRGHWIPIHTSAYTWFGWTGAHELVLQKGDRITVPEKSQAKRLLADWLQWKGTKPAVRYEAEIKPLPARAGDDAGPGHRRKNEQGEWALVGSHPLDPYLRDGAMAASRSAKTPGSDASSGTTGTPRP